MKTTSKRWATSVAISALCAAATLNSIGCTDGTSGGDAGTEPDATGPICTDLVTIACVDELVDSLLLQAGDVSPKEIVNTQSDGFLHAAVDATAGGLVADPRQSFLYAKFVDGGLEKVDINDDDALQSADWDIAFHRYIIRLNGGSSGPSCVSAATTGRAFDDVTVDGATGASYKFDDQFNESCAFRATEQAEDPANEQDFGVVLAAYYDYTGCLGMTGETFIVQLASRQHVKLEVTHFYEDQAQEECNDLGSNIPIGSASIQLKWAFLD